MVESEDRYVRERVRARQQMHAIARQLDGPLSELGAPMVLDRVLAEPGLRAQIADRLEDQRGAGGSAKARWRLDRADGRAESAGETTTRVTLMRLGVRVPDLQIDVATDIGQFRIDMGWRDLKIGIEFDGKVTYTRMADGEPAEVVFQEKRRQDTLEREGWILIGWCGPIWPGPADFLLRCIGGSRSGQPRRSGSGEQPDPALPGMVGGGGAGRWLGPRPRLGP